jgi:hypothetical protein
MGKFDVDTEGSDSEPPRSEVQYALVATLVAAILVLIVLSSIVKT